MSKIIDNYSTAVVKLRNSFKHYPEVISVMEDNFIGDSIIVILDSKRFDISKFKILIPSTYETYNINVLDIYSYVNGLQSVIDYQVLNEPLLWEPNVSLEIIESALNFYKKIIREYENERQYVECRRC